MSNDVPITPVKIIDPRIEPQPNPTYKVVVGPEQTQYYRQDASSASVSNISWNNLVTLGPQRVYHDSMEVALRAKFGIRIGRPALVKSELVNPVHVMTRGTYTIESFPLSKNTDIIRVNVNGGAFFSYPMQYLTPKERYWNQELLNKAYVQVCPVQRGWLQNECCRYSPENIGELKFGGMPTRTPSYISTLSDFDNAHGVMHAEGVGYDFRTGGFNGGNNVDLIGRLQDHLPREDWNKLIYYQADQDEREITLTIEWREPVFASPFNSRIDGNFGRPLYNITTLDIQYTLGKLENMFKWSPASGIRSVQFLGFEKAQLCYEVSTLPETLTAPPMTVVPYRKFVPYTTQFNGDWPVPNDATYETGKITIKSGVYTLNEIPEAIWIYLAPVKDSYYSGGLDGWTNNSAEPYFYSQSANKYFGCLEHISINCANTTQILNTCTQHDLYRIAKTNGCQDSFDSWARPHFYRGPTRANHFDNFGPTPGSVLRLIPGVDFSIPDQYLVPGTNADNMVFEVAEATFTVTNGVPPNYRKLALWILFEYVGVASFSPGQCNISMNPLANLTPSFFESAPTVSGASVAAQAPADIGGMEGSGFWDKIKSWLGIARKYAKDNQLVSKAVERFVPDSGIQGISKSTISKIVGATGYGYPGVKRMRGGAVMGLGDFC